MSGGLTADAALEACRLLGLEYRPDLRQPDGLWEARCPVCALFADGRPLTIREPAREMPVTFSCRSRCEADEIERALAAVVAGQGEPEAAQSAASAPGEALGRSRVDVIGMIRDGIPDREYVPGTGSALPKGKRAHVAAEKKTGKSLSMAVVTAVEIIAAGGSVAVLDRENGADEYVRRLAAVLDAREADEAFRELVKERLRYYAWPSLRLDWRDDPAYPEALSDADVVIFDSSRQHLTPLGLDENSSDDWSKFSSGLIDPLMQAGKTTITLDNTGWQEKERARGTTAKEDLCDIAFTMRVVAPFSLAIAGRLELRCNASRLGEITAGDTWQVELGAGHYGSWEKVGARPPEARDELRDAALEVLVAATEALGVNKIARAIRDRPGNTLRFADRDLRAGLEAWAQDPTSGILPGRSGKGFTAHGEPLRHGPHGETTSPWHATGPSATDKTQAAERDMPVADDDATARHGAHGGDGVSRRDATPATPGPENGHSRPLEDLAAEWYAEVQR